MADVVGDELQHAVLEVERHVAAEGWDQPTRLFALVPTRELLAAEPGLAESLLPPGSEPGAASDAEQLTPVEQDGLPQHDSLEALLDQIAWPGEVDGAAVVVERLMLPPAVEALIPEDETEALRFLAEHPERQEMRLAVGVLRDGRRACAIRLRSHADNGSVLAGPDLAPGLAAALAATLED